MNFAPPTITTLGPFSLPTFTLAITAAVLVSAALGLRQFSAAREKAANVYLLALVLGVIGARLVHVLLNWVYFAYNTRDIFQIHTGGLDWHGVVIGGLLGIRLGAHWHGLSSVELRNSLTLALPLLGLAVWWGCWAANCGYGAEVDTLANHPSWAVSEMPDVYGIPAPRYNTQRFGVLFSTGTLVLTILLVRVGWLRRQRFGLILALLSAGMFAIGFLRADYSVFLGSLRADQWLDLGLFLLGLILMLHVPKDTPT